MAAPRDNAAAGVSKAGSIAPLPQEPGVFGHGFWTSATLLIGCCYACVGVVAFLATGIANVVLGGVYYSQDVACEAPVRHAALALGCVELAFFVGTWVMACCASACTTMDKLVKNRMAALAMVVYLGFRYGVLIWSTVVAFDAQRWSRFQDAAPDFTCNRTLYHGFTSLVIAIWVLQVVSVCILVCAAPVAVSGAGSYLSGIARRNEERERRNVTARMHDVPCGGDDSHGPFSAATTAPAAAADVALMSAESPATAAAGAAGADIS